MKKINPPSISVTEVLSACSFDLQSCDTSLSDSFADQAVIKILSVAESIYRTKAMHGDLFTLRPNHNNVAKKLSIEDMKKAYKSLTKPKTKGKEIYDRIKLADQSQICPFCGHRSIVYIDHFLPKSRYPHFSITPINLVPICYECNSRAGKGSLYPTSDDSQFLHPYFDDFDDDVWLKASVKNTFPLTISYFTRKPLSWNDIKHKRIVYHFTKLRLNELYSSNATRELFNRKTTIHKIFEASGENGLVDFFRQEGTERRESEKNSWQAALYEGLSESTFFCHNALDLMQQ